MRASADLKKWGSQGGSVSAAESPAKAAALEALFARRRGKRVNDIGMPPHQYQRLLNRIRSALQHGQPGVISKRALADFCNVSDSTVRRWLAGENWPESAQVKRMQAWLKQID